MRLFWTCGLLGLGACGGASIETLEGCLGVDDLDKRDSCLADIAIVTYRADPAEGESLLAQITSSDVRDYVLHTYTREVDPSTRRWCEQIQGDQMRARCLTIVSRPHLHRELVGGPTGRPPPNSMGPGGDLSPDSEPIKIKVEGSDLPKPPGGP